MSDKTAQAVAGSSRSHRGTLKIFLGYAPGVGKTFAMLDEAHRRQRRGQDVVVGVVDARGRSETLEEAQGIDTIPLNTFNEMDVTRILERNPAVVLVDDLEHLNAPGSPRPHRWQDVDVLLNSGISVMSTLSVHSLESLNDQIRDITGVEVVETIPDHILHSADEIELIDLTPQALINRIDRGAIFGGKPGDGPLNALFREGNLSALREIAMREAAGRIDEDLTAYRRVKNIERPWATNDRVLICVAPNRNSLRLIRKGWRVGQRLRGEVIVLHVEGGNLNETETKILRDDFALAQRLGIRTVTLKGVVSQEIVKFARENSITQILMGHPERSKVQDLLRPNLVNELMKALRTVDILLVAAEVEESAH